MTYDGNDVTAGIGGTGGEGVGSGGFYGPPPLAPSGHNGLATQANVDGTTGCAPAHVIGAPVATATGVSDVVACTGASACQILETLTTTETLNGTKIVGVMASAARATLRHRKVNVGMRTVRVAAGKTASVTVSLTPTGRRLLARFAQLPVELTVALKRSGKRGRSRRAGSRSNPSATNRRIS